jgi:hypothetical protein
MRTKKQPSIQRGMEKPEAYSTGSVSSLDTRARAATVNNSLTLDGADSEDLRLIVNDEKIG